MRPHLANVLLLSAVCGCAWTAPPPQVFPPGLGTAAAVDNPLFVPSVDRDVVWEQMVDVVDDYFQIEREQRVQRIGDVLVEGRLETAPRYGATLLEPWRRDSVGRAEQWESTLQTIRRRAHVAVRPADGGFLVEVAVLKELEDLERPEFSTAGGAAPRHDTSIRRVGSLVVNPPQTLGWIPRGRDGALEAQLLAQLAGRFHTAPVLPGPSGPPPYPALPEPIRLPPVGR